MSDKKDINVHGINLYAYSQDLTMMAADGSTVRSDGIINDRTGAACIHSWSKEYEIKPLKPPAPVLSNGEEIFQGVVKDVISYNGKFGEAAIPFISYQALSHETQDREYLELVEMREKNTKKAISADEAQNTSFKLKGKEHNGKVFCNNRGLFVCLPGLYNCKFTACRDPLDESGKHWIVQKVLEENPEEPCTENIIALLQFVLKLNRLQVIDLLRMGGYEASKDSLENVAMLEDYYAIQEQPQLKDAWNGIWGLRPGYYCLSLSDVRERDQIIDPDVLDKLESIKDKEKRKTEREMIERTLPIRNTAIEKYLTVVHILHRAESNPKVAKSLKAFFTWPIENKGEIPIEDGQKLTAQRPVTPSVTFSIHPSVTQFFGGVRFQRLCEIYPKHLLQGLTVFEIHHLYDVITGVFDYRSDVYHEGRFGDVTTMAIYAMFFSPAMKNQANNHTLDPMNRHYRQYIYTMRPHMFTTIDKPRRLPELSLYDLIFIVQKYGNKNDLKARMMSMPFLFSVLVYHVMKESYYSNRHGCISVDDIKKLVMRIIRPDFALPQRWIEANMNRYSWSHPESKRRHTELVCEMMELLDYSCDITDNQCEEKIIDVLAALCSDPCKPKGVGVMVAWDPKDLKAFLPNCLKEDLEDKVDADDENYNYLENNQKYIFLLESYMQTASLTSDMITLTKRFIECVKKNRLPQVMPFYRMAEKQDWSEKLAKSVLRKLQGGKEMAMDIDVNSSRIVPSVDEIPDDELFDIMEQFEGTIPMQIKDNDDDDDDDDYIPPPPSHPCPPPKQLSTSVTNPKFNYVRPKVVKLRRTKKGKVLQDCDIYIGREYKKDGWNLEASKWRNIFTIKKYGLNTCLEKYEEYVRSSPMLLKSLRELSGKTLGCWCKKKPSDPCHGDILVRLCDEFLSTDSDFNSDDDGDGDNVKTEDQMVPDLKDLNESEKVNAIMRSLDSLPGKIKPENLSVPVNCSHWCAEQEFAWQMMMKMTPVSNVSGRAGSGKTRLASRIMQQFRPQDIICVCVMNSHISNLKDVVRQICGGHEPGFMGTIHQLLKLHNSSCINISRNMVEYEGYTDDQFNSIRENWNKYPYRQHFLWRHAAESACCDCPISSGKLLVVDESSVTDMASFVRLVNIFVGCCKQSVRVVNLGDFRQLPPVSPRQPFIQMLYAFGGIELQRSHRSNSDAINSACNAISTGNYEKLNNICIELEPDDITPGQDHGVYKLNCSSKSITKLDPKEQDHPANVMTCLFEKKGMDFYKKSLVICETHNVRIKLCQTLDEWYFHRYFREMKFPQTDYDKFFTKSGRLHFDAIYSQQKVTYTQKDQLGLSPNRVYMAEVIEGEIVHIDSAALMASTEKMFKVLCDSIMEVSSQVDIDAASEAAMLSVMKDNYYSKVSMALWVMARQYAKLNSTKHVEQYNEALGRFQAAVRESCRTRLLSYIRKQAVIQNLEALELESILCRQFHDKEVHLLKFGGDSRSLWTGLGYSELHRNPLLMEARLFGWNDYISTNDTCIELDIVGTVEGDVSSEAIEQAKTIFDLIEKKISKIISLGHDKIKEKLQENKVYVSVKDKGIGLNEKMIRDTYNMVKRLFTSCVTDLLWNNNQKDLYEYPDGPMARNKDRNGVFSKESSQQSEKFVYPPADDITVGKIKLKLGNRVQSIVDPTKTICTDKNLTVYSAIDGSEEQPSFESLKLALEGHYHSVGNMKTEIRRDDYIKFYPTKKNIYHTLMNYNRVGPTKYYRMVILRNVNNPTEDFAYIPYSRWKSIKPYSAMTAYAAEGLQAENIVYVVSSPSDVEDAYVSASRAIYALYIVTNSWALKKTLSTHCHVSKDVLGAILRKYCGNMLEKELGPYFDMIEEVVIVPLKQKDREEREKERVNCPSSNFCIPCRGFYFDMGSQYKEWQKELETAIGDNNFYGKRKLLTAKDRWLMDED